MTNTLLKQTISMGEALSVSVTGIIVVMIILALLAIRAVESKAHKKNANSAEEKVLNPVIKEQKNGNSLKALPETQSIGSLDLYKTDEKTAAIIMAIVSNESGIPLNRLQFNSIKLIEE